MTSYVLRVTCYTLDIKVVKHGRVWSGLVWILEGWFWGCGIKNFAWYQGGGGRVWGPGRRKVWGGLGFDDDEVEDEDKTKRLRIQLQKADIRRRQQKRRSLDDQCKWSRWQGRKHLNQSGGQQLATATFCSTSMRIDDDNNNGDNEEDPDVVHAHVRCVVPSTTRNRNLEIKGSEGEREGHSDTYKNFNVKACILIPPPLLFRVLEDRVGGKRRGDDELS
ncbi:hypothetical protein EV361DRAFT_869713 [Lentinula raphanica]|uniref:Uncharacterized protein n=1 Tax=Lentinula raphanica TaxID=153919 RepID=A0AA38U6W4_9AGAR|nr:hypothetical protein F5878DRAFT_700141 [Lentinula raphanica]KAJ3969904.1 hypothetical protein EV361DRAFT_869713 [Lentinula raphanica]